MRSVCRSWYARSSVVVFAVLMQASTGFAQRGPSVVELAKVEKRLAAAKQSTLGTIMPSRRAVIGSAVDGRVVEFLVRQGDRVDENAPLARLLTSTISLEIVAAKAELELRQAELEELQNGSRPEEIAQAKARVEATRVMAQYLEANQRRFAELGNTSAVSRSEFENALSLYEEATQRHIEAKAAYELAVNGTRAEKIVQADARVKMQTAVVERLEDQLEKHTMRSRFAGYVTIEHTEVGQWLPRGSPVAEIIALDEVDVLAKVVETHIPFIHVGDAIAIEVPTLPDVKLQGVVQAVIPEADERSRTFPVKIRVQNTVNALGEIMLKAGMLARASFPTEEPREVLMVPKDALVLSDDKKMVWIVDGKSIEEAAGGMLQANAAVVPVTTGTEDQDWVEIIGVVSPIVEGSMVVIRGNERIPPAPPGAPPSRIMWRKN